MPSDNLKSQNQKILRHLCDGGSLTPVDALARFGCFRLAARIADLRSDGWIINKEMISKDDPDRQGKKVTFASYSIDRDRNLEKIEFLNRRINSITGGHHE
jgi:hypothetical protein